VVVRQGAWCGSSEQTIYMVGYWRQQAPMRVDSADQMRDSSLMGISTKSSGDKVHTGSDLYAPTWVELTVTGMEDIDVDYVAVLVLEGRRYVVQELRILRRDDGPPITSELIRGIPVAMLIRGTVSNLVELRTDPDAVYESDGLRLRAPEQVVITPDERRRMVEAGPTDDTLLWVARIYIMAELAGDPPAKSVKETLDTPTSTAGYWIRRAKDRGILKQPATTGEPHPANPKQTPIADPEHEKRVRAAKARARERQRAIDAGEIT
jgi:hypothetical protein